MAGSRGEPLMQLRRIAQHPAMGCGMVNLQTRAIKSSSKSQGKTVSIPADAKHDDIILKMASLEQGWPIIFHLLYRIKIRLANRL